MIERLKNQKITAGQFRALLTLEGILVVLILALGYFGYQQYQLAQEAAGNLETQERRLTALKDDLLFFESSNNQQQLEEELAQLRAIPLPQRLPGVRQALDVGREITVFAQEQGLPLTSFDRVEIKLKLGEDLEFPAQSYSIIVRGQEAGLIAMLQLLKEFPTAKVRTLEFTRPPTAAEGARERDWEMKLNLDVVYR